MVIPVRIKERWLLFEGPDQSPALPDDVVAVLTPEELSKFKRDWLEVEAQRWAREIAKDMPAPPPARATERRTAIDLDEIFTIELLENGLFFIKMGVFCQKMYCFFWLKTRFFGLNERFYNT